MDDASRAMQQSLLNLLAPQSLPKKRSFNRTKEGTFGKASKEEASYTAQTLLSPNSKKKRKKYRDRDLKNASKEYNGRLAPYPLQIGGDQPLFVYPHASVDSDEEVDGPEQSPDKPIQDQWSNLETFDDDEMEDFNMLHSVPDLDLLSCLNGDENFYRRSPSPREIHHLAEDGSQISAKRLYKQKLSEAWSILFDDPKQLFIKAFLQAEADMYCHQAAPKATPCHCSSGTSETTVTSVNLTGTSQTTTVSFCRQCSNAVTALMQQGLFAASPSQPRSAFGIDVLQFYLRAGVIHKAPIQGFADALAMFHEDHGMPIHKQHPYLEQLKSCLPWFDALLRRVELYVESILQSQPLPVTLEHCPISPSQSEEWPALHKGEAHPYLVQRCAACFGRQYWGGDPERCPDVIAATDGNFQHRLYKHMFDDPELLPPGDEFGWLTAQELADAKKHLEACRASKVKSSRQRRGGDVPPQVLDECEKSYKAAQEKLQGLDNTAFRVKGLMALVCNHDVPLFLADITTLGEPRYLVIALLRKLASLLPEQATIGVMYDIADQLERTILSTNVMPELSDRLSFAVALFHAFGHRIQCQVVYNPRYRTGFGLANGEGNERIWSLSRDLIGAQRVMGPHRRKLTISRKMEHIANCKASSYRTYTKSMVTRMKKMWNESLLVIFKIPAVDGEIWDRKRLLEEWETKKKHHLSAKEYSEAQLTVQIRSLLEASRNASGMTNAIRQLRNELDHEEYRTTLFPDRPTEMEDLRDYVTRVGELHDESLKQLEELTQRIGLSQIEVPEHLSNQEQHFLKMLINLQVQRHQLWISLQAYQDEHGPVGQASSRGGRLGQLGTTKLATASTALKQKSKIVLNAAKNFNITISALRQRQKPAWVPDGLIPTTVAGDKLLHLEQSDEDWEEIFGGTPWVDGFQDPDGGGRIPAYARSQEIRRGILAALAMDRIEEQAQRLETERANVLNSWILRLFRVWECNESKKTDMPWICHRLEKSMSQLLRNRPQCSVSAAIWRSPIKHLMQCLRHQHPSLLCGTDMFSISLTPIIVMTDQGFPEVVTDGREFIGSLKEKVMEDVTEGNPRPNKDLADSDQSSDSDALDEADEQDFALRDQQYDDIYRGLENLTVNEDESTPSQIPSVLNLMNRVDGRTLRTSETTRVATDNRDLPSVTLLLDAATGRSTGSEPLFPFYSAGTEATLRNRVDHVTLGRESRFFGQVEITSDDLRTMDQGRHISPKLAPILCHLVKDSIDSSSGARAAAPSLQIRSALCVSITSVTTSHALERSVAEVGDAKLWLVPLQFKSRTSRWGLLTFDTVLRTIQHSSGGPMDKIDKDLICNIAKELGRLYDAESDNHPGKRWGLVDLTAYGREAMPSHSVLWLCEDLKHRLLGTPVPPNILNINAVRNNLRDLVHDLPNAPPSDAVTAHRSNADEEPARTSVIEALQRIQSSL